MASAEPGRRPHIQLIYDRGLFGSVLVWILNSERLQTISMCLSVPCIISTYKQFSLTGDVAPKQQPSRIGCRSLDHSDELIILGIILDTPSTYLQEHAKQCMK